MKYAFVAASLIAAVAASPAWAPPAYGGSGSWGESSAAGGWGESTVEQTTIATITSCGPEVTNCPANSSPETAPATAPATTPTEAVPTGYETSPVASSPETSAATVPGGYGSAPAPSAPATTAPAVPSSSYENSPIQSSAPGYGWGSSAESSPAAPTTPVASTPASSPAAPVPTGGYTSPAAPYPIPSSSEAGAVGTGYPVASGSAAPSGSGTPYSPVPATGGAAGLKVGGVFAGFVALGAFLL